MDAIIPAELMQYAVQLTVYGFTLAGMVLGACCGFFLPATQGMGTRRMKSRNTSAV